MPDHYGKPAKPKAKPKTPKPSPTKDAKKKKTLGPKARAYSDSLAAARAANPVTTWERTDWKRGRTPEEMATRFRSLRKLKRAKKVFDAAAKRGSSRKPVYPDKDTVIAAWSKALRKAGVNPHKVMAAQDSVSREFK